MENLNIEVQELHNKGYSYNQIAKELGITKLKAYRIINEKVNVPKSETVSEQDVSKPTQNTLGQSKKKNTDKRNNTGNLKLQVKLRKMELEHEAGMKRLELEEQERIREYESKKSSVKNENQILKTKLDNLRAEIENLKEKTVKLEQMKISERIEGDYDIEENFEEETFEEDYIPELDMMIKEKIIELLSHILKTDKYYEEDLEDLITTMSNLTKQITEQSEIEEVEISYFEEYRLLKGTEKVIQYYQENFVDDTSFFGSTIYHVFEDDLFSQIEEYANNDIEE